MKKWILVLVVLTGMAMTTSAQTKNSYINNRAPLKPNPYIELPLGAIRAEGWLKEKIGRAHV